MDADDREEDKRDSLECSGPFDSQEKSLTSFSEHLKT